MPWFAILDRLYDESHKLHAAGHRLDTLRIPTPDAIRQHGPERAVHLMICDLMDEQSKSADLACEHFASAGKWPMMSQDATLAVWQRVAAARDFVEFLVHPKGKASGGADGQPAGYSDAALWRWLLVDYWHVGGRHRWIAYASSK